MVKLAKNCFDSVTAGHGNTRLQTQIDVERNEEIKWRNDHKRADVKETTDDDGWKYEEPKERKKTHYGVIVVGIPKYEEKPSAGRTMVQ